MESESVLNFTSLPDLLGNVFAFANGEDVIYRGQGVDYPLLPGIARADPTKDMTAKELLVQQEIRRRLAADQQVPTTDWGLTTYSQHYGMPTRLLDWSHNPLVAIWFAIQSAQREKSAMAYLYLLRRAPAIVLHDIATKKIHDIEQVWVINPPFNNPRISAQSGCFTAHPYSVRSQRYVAVADDAACKNVMMKMSISKSAFNAFIRELDVLGINSNAIYPDFSGLCDYLKWKHLI